MKAQSVVLRLVQKPLTQFGVPQLLLPVVVAAPAVILGLLIAIDLMVLALPVAALVAVATWTLLFVANRRDPHFVSVIMRSQRFWRGRRHRVPIAGAPR